MIRVIFCGHAEYGYLIRSSIFDSNNPPVTDIGFWSKDNSIQKGFVAQDSAVGHEASGCTHGFVANSSKESAFKTDNNKFFILPDGTHQSFATAYKVRNNPSEGISVTDAPLHIIVADGTYNLHSPAEGQFLVVKLYSFTEDEQVLINGYFFQHEAV